MVNDITISVIKADIGSFTGHGIVHPAIIDLAKENLEIRKEDGPIIDYHVTNCGDDLELIMTHREGENNPKIHSLAWNIFQEGTKKAKELHLYAAGQDILSNSFSGNIRGMGPGIVEIEFEERRSEPIIVFMMDKTEPGAFNLPFFRVFADPFCTAGLVIDPSMSEGFNFEIVDVLENRSISLSCPEEMYALLALIGTTERYVIRRVFKNANQQVCASVSTVKLNMIAGRYVGKDDPVAVVRAQSGFPAVGEILEPYAFPHLVAGWMRGSHYGPIMPVGQKDACCTRFDGPPRIVALGFQLANGRLVGPVDYFGDPAFDRARLLCNEVADYMRRHGPFMPGRLGSEAMEYTALPKMMEKLKDRFRKE